ncbi:hypothetical protein P4H27_09950 [Paenibacillus taichungensis]|uniref:hypothetical protein n=1 Tax=Paenibacillus taichungensis TaxID=484184 RepID=UPI002DB9CEB4|nr:hypothetical protein [Paenibacillus taichungensis]MEC0107258.1 hypothetical protein [Paenibacillus taichungensis]MEC0194810.1 hypothetical protein [Paenibacillus taichungensis]
MEKKTVTAPPSLSSVPPVIYSRSFDAKVDYLRQLMELKEIEPDSEMIQSRIDKVCDSIENDLQL